MRVTLTVVRVWWLLGVAATCSTSPTPLLTMCVFCACASGLQRGWARVRGLGVCLWGDVGDVRAWVSRTHSNRYNTLEVVLASRARGTPLQPHAAQVAGLFGLSALTKAAVLSQLRQLNIECVVSPFEAEPQCAYLCKTGYTECTITDDVDAHMYGDHRVSLLTDSLTWQGTEYNLAAVLACPAMARIPGQLVRCAGCVCARVCACVCACVCVCVCVCVHPAE